MNKYVAKLCSLGIPACRAYSIVADFLKNYGTSELEEYISSLEDRDSEAWRGVPCVY